MRKPAFCICENKAADQLCGYRTADQRLCFRYTDSTIPLLPVSEISSLKLSSVAAQPSLCRTWLETPKTGFLTSGLIFLIRSLNITVQQGQQMSRIKSKHDNCICENRGADQLCSNHAADQNFVFATWIVQSFYFLISSSSHLLCLYSWV